MKLNRILLLLVIIITRQAFADDGLDRDVIADVINAQMPKILKCYEVESSKTPGLNGQIRIDFSINQAGTVTDPKIVETTLKSLNAENCIVALSRQWRFPKPSGLKPVHVSYPFVFKKMERKNKN